MEHGEHSRELEDLEHESEKEEHLPVGFLSFIVYSSPNVDRFSFLNPDIEIAFNWLGFH